LQFLSKPELGWSMLRPLIETNRVPFGWIAMDEGYGVSTPLLDRLAAANRRYFAEIPRSTHVWRRRPRVVRPGESAPTATGARPRTRTHLAEGAPATHRVEEIAKRLPAKSWQAFIIHEGSKGPLAVEIAAVRVVTVTDGLPGRDEWLVIRRPSARAPLKDWKFYRSNAAADVPVKTLARLTAWRWPVETTIEECKQELGWDHYEVRGWTGWHHHTTMTILSHGFLVKLRVEMGEKAPALTISQVRRLLQVVLPRREWTEAEILAEIRRLQERNHAAYRSHRKRQLRVIRLRGQPSRRSKASGTN
jgi:SRSO17 transposase